MSYYGSFVTRKSLDLQYSGFLPSTPAPKGY